MINTLNKQIQYQQVVCDRNKQLCSQCALMKEGLVDHGQLVLEGTPTEIKKKMCVKLTLMKDGVFYVKQDISRKKQIFIMKISW